MASELEENLQLSIPRRKRVYSFYGDDMGGVITEDGKLLVPGDARHCRDCWCRRSPRNRGQKPRKRALVEGEGRKPKR